MRTSYTYFIGGAGADIGLAAAGYTSKGGVEYDNAIADVARSNGHSVTTADVRDVDPLLLLDAAPDWFHASPSCKKASQANSDGGETDEDRECGKAVARFIDAWQPQTVSIENVWGYRTFDAFGYILEALKRNGYSYEFWHLNSADYGVPQTRKRLILLARKGVYRIQRPAVTHQEGGDLFAAPWIGWYEAIEDLIPTLPESKFAPWQLDRLPNYIGETTMLWNMDQTARDVTQRRANQPVPTVDTGMFRRPSSIPQAFLITDQSASAGRGVLIRDGGQPASTIRAGTSGGAQPRAWLIDGQNAGRDITLRADEEPCYTLGAQNKGSHRALLVHSTDMRSMPVRDEADPAFTVMAQSFDKSHAPGGRPRAWLTTGRVVSMTPRALACFQSVPRWYTLPEKNGLACTVIGNMVPPLLMQRLAEASQ